MTLLTRKRFLRTAGAAAFGAAVPTTLPAQSQSPMAQPPMVRKPIPRSPNGETMPVIGLGTNRYKDPGNAAETAQRMDVIRTLLDAGGSVIDTAEGYGQSEAVLGDLFTRMGNRDQVFIATKVSERGRDNGIETMEKSFRELQTNVIDLMMVHNLRNDDVHLPTMLEWKAAGRFRYVGVSHFLSWFQSGVIPVMETGNLDFIQIKYSVDVRGAEKRILPVAQDLGVAVMINVPLGRGSLLEDVEGQSVPEWAREELGCETFAQLLLKFVISHPAVTVTIPGTTKAKHMADNVVAGQGPLADAKQRARIAAIWD